VFKEIGDAPCPDAMKSRQHLGRPMRSLEEGREEGEKRVASLGTGAGLSVDAPEAEPRRAKVRADSVSLSFIKPKSAFVSLSWPRACPS
jgi:hypothetical protein